MSDPLVPSPSPYFKLLIHEEQALCQVRDVLGPNSETWRVIEKVLSTDPENLSHEVFVAHEAATRAYVAVHTIAETASVEDIKGLAKVIEDAVEMVINSLEDAGVPS